jgi:hypothetical protein
MEDIKEYFIDVKGYEGLYEISNLGRLKSLNYNHTRQPRIMKPSIGSRGYYHTLLWKNGESKDFCIYQIVAMSFLQIPSDKLNHIHHVDFDKTNDCAYNLEPAKCRENICYGKYGIKSGVSKHLNKYRARISYYGFQIHIGMFNTIELAHEAYLMFFEHIENLRDKKIID